MHYGTRDSLVVLLGWGVGWGGGWGREESKRHEDCPTIQAKDSIDTDYYLMSLCRLLKLLRSTRREQSACKFLLSSNKDKWLLRVGEEVASERKRWGWVRGGGWVYGLGKSWTLAAPGLNDDGPSLSYKYTLSLRFSTSQTTHRPHTHTYTQQVVLRSLPPDKFLEYNKYHWLSTWYFTKHGSTVAFNVRFHKAWINWSLQRDISQSMDQL